MPCCFFFFVLRPRRCQRGREHKTGAERFAEGAAVLAGTSGKRDCIRPRIIYCSLSSSSHLVISLKQNQLQEAESCVQDCRDCVSAAELDHELATADQAIDQAVQRLLDVLEGAKQHPSSSSISTLDWVQRIKQLRAEVNLLKQRPAPSPIPRESS
jgi:hypothetical protein